MKNLNPILFLLIIALFSSKNIYSQKKVIIVDSLTGEILPYATINIKNNHGVYSNANGIFNSEEMSGNKLTISYLGYHTKTILSNNLKDTLYLSPKTEILNEIVIHKKKHTVKEITFLKTPNSFSSAIITPNTEIITLVIPAKKIIDYSIDKVKFSFQKLRYSKNKEQLKAQQSIVRINIYQILNDNISDLIYSSKPLKIDAYNRSELEINLENKFIVFQREGLAFSIEYIGNIDNNGSFLKTEKQYIRPKLAKNKSKYYTYTTYIKYPLQNEEIIKPFNDIINQNLPKGMNKTFNRNLNISFTLSK